MRQSSAYEILNLLTGPARSKFRPPVREAQQGTEFGMHTVHVNDMF